jgi:hypothetical protein
MNANQIFNACRRSQISGTGMGSPGTGLGDPFCRVRLLALAWVALGAHLLVGAVVLGVLAN